MPSWAATPAPKMNPRASIPAMSSAPAASARAARWPMQAAKPSPWLSSVVMSRNSTPGSGKFGTVRISARSSAGVMSRLAARKVASSVVALHPAPDVLVGEPGERGGDEQEQHHRPAGLVALGELGLGGPDEERGNVLGHLIDGRARAVAVSDLTGGGQRRRHRQVEVGEIRIVVRSGRA